MSEQSQTSWRTRKAMKIRPDLHAVAERRHKETGIPIQRTIDEAIELGFKMKKLLPVPTEE